jgi:outer membrane protein assembly factor BamA
MKCSISNIFFTFVLCVFCMLHLSAAAQKVTGFTTAYTLIIHYKDTVNKSQLPPLQTSFATLKEQYDYINGLPKSLASKGFAVASVDSTWQTGDTAHIILYIGTKYNWIELRTKGIDKAALLKSGFASKNFNGKALNIANVDIIKQRLLSYYENVGYPFATIFLDSISIEDDRVNAMLVTKLGELYHIDSIVNYGKLKLNKRFLQNYLGLTDGSIYSREKLMDVDRRMAELPYADMQQPSSLNMLGSGSVLNLYVNQRKSSQISAILGLLPDANNTGKFQLTGDVNLDLKNVFGAGEGLLIRYQALQPKSPRLNLGYDKPYILHSQFGLSFLFDLFKKDSSFLNLNAQLGLALNLNANQTGKALVQWQTTSLLQGGYDTNAIKINKILPDNIDVKSVNAGITYEYIKTNYRYNPRTGNELSITGLAGIKTIQKNADIVNLKSGTFNFASLYDSVKLKSYQFRIKSTLAHYFPVAKAATIKLALNAGVYSSPDIFRNEVFQIGGYRLLRGFDEESIYATQYGVLTAEYRYLLSRNSYLFGFIDAAVTKATYQNVKTSNQFTGAGAGILYETKAGLLNLSIALGKRDDVPFNFRGAAKIHFGYINYF